MGVDGGWRKQIAQETGTRVREAAKEAGMGRAGTGKQRRRVASASAWSGMGDRVGDSQGEGAGGNLDDLDKEMRSIVSVGA